MKPAVLFVMFVTLFSQAMPVMAQGAPALSRSAFRAPEGAYSVRIQPPTPRPGTNINRSVSGRRLALGALIGGVAGATLGYVMTRRSCGATSTREECDGWGHLGAVMGGGVGAAVGFRVAFGGP